MGYTSVAHRVMSIPELLELVFDHLDRTSNASNASVCKTWHHIALDTLWREVDNIHMLFSHLAPLVQSYPTSPFVSPTTPCLYRTDVMCRCSKEDSTQVIGPGLHRMRVG